MVDRDVGLPLKFPEENDSFENKIFYERFVVQYWIDERREFYQIKN